MRSSQNSIKSHRKASNSIRKVNPMLLSKRPLEAYQPSNPGLESEENIHPEPPDIGPECMP